MNILISKASWHIPSLASILANLILWLGAIVDDTVFLDEHGESVRKRWTRKKRSLWSTRERGRLKLTYTQWTSTAHVQNKTGSQAGLGIGSPLFLSHMISPHPLFFIAMTRDKYVGSRIHVVYPPSSRVACPSDQCRQPTPDTFKALVHEQNPTKGSLQSSRWQ